MPVSQRTLHVELMAGPDLLEGPGAAAVDVLRLVNTLALLRGQRRVPVAWQWISAQGSALRRPGAVGRRTRWPDVLLVPGWAARSGAHLSRLVSRDAAAAARLRAVHEAGGQIVALYTGVALAGSARLVEGRRAVVPWPFMAAVLRHAPGLELAEGEAWTRSDRLWTADSPVAATELLLRVLQHLGLEDLAESARVVLTHAPERQRLARAVAEDNATRLGPGALERARRWLEDHLHEPYSLAATARAAATSERSLLRHFRAVFAQTPLQMLHALRVTRARMLLETSYLSIDAIAERCGWRDTAMLRRVFSAATGLTPAAYRERHRLRTRRRQWGQDLAN